VDVLEMQQQAARRRPSRLGDLLRQAKLERARQMSPQERLLIALDLSDLCLALKRACPAAEPVGRSRAFTDLLARIANELQST
jgi:hypothetical protein